MASVALLGLLGVACGGDDDVDEPASDTPTPGSQATTTLGPETEVEAAYLAHWEMLDRLGEAPDPDDPEIAERTSGEALLQVVDGLRTLQARGHISQVGPLYARSVESVDVSGDQAVVLDCVIDDGSLVDQTTGEVVEPGQAATGLLEVTLVFEQDRWKVSSVDTVFTRPGATSCDG